MLSLNNTINVSGESHCVCVMREFVWAWNDFYCSGGTDFYGEVGAVCQFKGWNFTFYLIFYLSVSWVRQLLGWVQKQVINSSAGKEYFVDRSGSALIEFQKHRHHGSP